MAGIFFSSLCQKALGSWEGRGGGVWYYYVLCVYVGRFAYGLCCMETTITLFSNFFNEKMPLAGPQAPTPMAPAKRKISDFFLSGSYSALT